jgi:proteasome component ECM29
VTAAAASGNLSAAEQKKKESLAGDGKESFRQLAGAARAVDASLTPSLLSLAGDASLLGGRAAAFAGDDVRLVRAARAQLLPHLPRMFPSLFRGQYWPEVYVARSFRRVLRALCFAPPADVVVLGSEEEKPAKRTKGVELTLADLLTQYLEPTCALLVSSARDRDAEVREASMSALPDVLAGRSWNEMKDVFAALWKMVLGGMDDMRDVLCLFLSFFLVVSLIQKGVRIAAAQALSSLSSFTARLVDPAHTQLPDSATALKIVIEILCEEGIGSPAKEVQSKSVVVLKTIISAAGTLIEPHVADLLEKLLHCASALEPEMISYLAQQQNTGISSEDLHKARAAMSRMTPLGECVDLCLKHVSNDTVLPVVKVSCKKMVCSFFVYCAHSCSSEHRKRLAGSWFADVVAISVGSDFVVSRRSCFGRLERSACHCSHAQSSQRNGETNKQFFGVQG